MQKCKKQNKTSYFGINVQSEKINLLDMKSEKCTIQIIQYELTKVKNKLIR